MSSSANDSNSHQPLHWHTHSNTFPLEGCPGNGSLPHTWDRTKQKSSEWKWIELEGTEFDRDTITICYLQYFWQMTSNGRVKKASRDWDRTSVWVCVSALTLGSDLLWCPWWYKSISPSAPGTRWHGHYIYRLEEEKVRRNQIKMGTWEIYRGR